MKNVADPVSNALLAEYESDDALDQTYVGYAGSADLSTQASYVRIDGPRVWIEASVQGGIIYKNIVHYHTVWRDKIADYVRSIARSELSSSLDSHLPLTAAAVRARGGPTTRAPKSHRTQY